MSSSDFRQIAISGETERADRLFRAAVSAFCSLTRPSRREIEQLERLKRSLAVYRMVFGQPRQEDLVAYLADRLSATDLARYQEAFRVDLSPPRARISRATP